MNFYFEFTTCNYKTYYAIALELSKLFPGSKFAGIDGSHGNVARQYLEKQAGIKYDFLHDYRDVINSAINQNMDYKLLSEFEESLPEKSLWRIIAVDREWAHQFVKGVYLPRSYIHTINSHENILKVATGLIKFYKKVISDFKPDVFIPAAGQNSMSSPIIEQLCNNHNILYILPETIRTKNYMALMDNRQCVATRVNNICRQLIDKKINLDLSSGEKCYYEIMSDLENKNYFDVVNISHLKSKWQWLKFLYRSSLSIAREIGDWQKTNPLRKRKDTVFKQPDNIMILFYNFYYAILQHYRRIQLLDSKFYSVFNPNQKYVYFPLHNTNEYSTQVQGTMWINQLQIIEALAKSIPFDWKVVVKEHPGVLLYRVRPMSFYKEIKNYSNVLLIPTDTKFNVVISNAQLVVTIAGTTGWEAIIRGKPVISFEENMYDALGLSRRCSDFKELSVAIHDEIQRIKGVPVQEKKRRVVCLLTAIIKHGFWLDDPLKFYNDSVSNISDRDAIEMGKIIAKSIKDYIQNVLVKYENSFYNN